MPEFRVLPAGDTALVIEFGKIVDRQLNAGVLALDRRLNEIRLEGVVETVPTFRSLMVHYDPLVLPAARLTARIAELIEDVQLVEQPSRLWYLPACYDAAFALDLCDIAAHTGLSQSQVIERHSATTYHVYMLGFLPGQAYMGDLPLEFALRRRDTPRPKIPAGALAIAASMTCIFPLETPCGWHVIGRSPVPLWQRQPHASALLAPGDKVSFTPISVREYEATLAKVAEGSFEIAPTEFAVGAEA